MLKISQILVIIFFISTSFSSLNIADSLNLDNDIIYVDDDGGLYYSTIQDALNVANNGDTVFVYSGFYNENIIINKSINLIGEDKFNTFISGNYFNDVITVLTNDVMISNFTIINSGMSGRDVGIKITGNNVLIRNNVISNNTIGVFIESSINCIIESNNIKFNSDSGVHILNSFENNITSNEICYNRWGILSVSSFNNSIEENDIYLNELYGIWLLRGCFGNVIQNNNIQMNSEYGICLNLFCGFNLIYNNSISYSNYCGINIGNYWSCDSNSIIENKIFNNYNFGVYIQESNSNLISGNIFLNNSIDASFINCYDNIWEYNYWNEDRSIPKIIFGKYNMIPFFNFDWDPVSISNQFFCDKNYLDFNEFIYLSDDKNKDYLDLPSSFSWRDIDGVDFTPSIKNQNPAPTCEAYALCASLETLVQYKIGYPFGCDLSEAHLFFYSGGTCDWGVDIQETAEYLIDYGVPDEGCFPDPHRPFDFPFESISGWEDRAIKIKEWGWVNNDVESIKKALVEFGPLVICQMTRRDLDNYDGGIYMPRISSPIQRGHVVTIIGYDDIDRCWTIRNSGGVNWGEEGYYRVSYDAFDPIYSFIYPFYGGTGILYVDGVYGDLKPDVPKIEIEIPKLYHTYIFDNEINTIFKRVSNIQRGGPRIFGDLSIVVNTSNTKKVEFYIDGEFQFIDENEPYEWVLNSSNGLHTIEVFAYNDNSFSKDIVDVFVI